MILASDSMDAPIDSLIGNREEILRQLENEPSLKCDDQESDGSLKIATGKIMKRERELSHELHDLTGLKTFPALVLEFQTNLELLELENCYYSLQTLRKKLRDSAPIINRSFGLQRSVATYVDNMHLDLVNKLYDILTNGFWCLKEDSISFHQSIVYGKEKTAIEYREFMESLENLYFPQGRRNSKLWIVSEMVIGTLQETVRSKLNTILKEYIQMTGAISVIKSSIFAENKRATLDDDNKTLSFRTSSTTGDDAIKEIAISLNSIVYFLTEIIGSQGKSILAEKLGPLIATELIKFVKASASSVFRTDNSELRTEIGRINNSLKKLSKQAGSWSYNGLEVDNLFNNDEIPMRLQLDKIFQEQLTELRVFFSSEASKTLQSVESIDVTQASPTHVRSTVKRSSDKSTENDEWGWDDDAGWDEQIDLASNEESSIKRGNETNVRADEEEDDGWDEAWDLEIDDDDNEKETESHGAKGSELKLEHPQSVKVTQLPHMVLSVIENLERESQKIGQNKLDKHYYRHKLNVLETFIMAVSTRHFQDRWWQLFIDMKFIIKKRPSLTRLKELTYNQLELYLNARETVVYQLVSQQLNELGENEKDPSWNVTIDKLLPFIHAEIIKPLVRIGGIDGEDCLSKFLKFLYVDCIVNNIRSWRIISEKSSENLSEFVSLISSKTEIETLNSNASYREQREKFAIIGKFLPLHLKEIMEMFYSGDFYLFTTDELVQWIILLFAETPLRRNAIDDIYEIRNADVGDDE